MLVISRKFGQQIHIGGQITVTILKAQGQTVRVGIEAPRDVKVLRAELPPLPATIGTATVSPRRPEGAAIGPAGGQLSSLGGDASPKERVPGRDAMNSGRRTQPHHPQRWTVTSMRERVEGQASPRAVSTNDSVHSM